MDYKLVLVTGPVVEPVDLATAKLHLRVDTSDDDGLIEDKIQAAREEAEEFLGRALISQTWKIFMDGFPGSDQIKLPKPPLISVTHIKYYDVLDAVTTFAATNYVVDIYSEPGKIVLKSGCAWPSATLRVANGVEVQFVCGYGAAAASVPLAFRQGMLLVIGSMYENREDVVAGGGMNVLKLPQGAEYLWWKKRFKNF